MSTFPQRFKLSDLLLDTGIDVKPLITALGAIADAGNWPDSMPRLSDVRLNVIDQLGVIEVVAKTELAKQANQKPFEPTPENLWPEPIDLSKFADVVPLANQVIATAFDPDNINVVMADPDVDDTLRAVNFNSKQRGLQEGYLYLELIDVGQGRIVLETLTSS